MLALIGLQQFSRFGVASGNACYEDGAYSYSTFESSESSSESWGDSRLFGFRLPYNQVTSVDAAGSAIIVHTSGAQYKCYVANPAEIQRAIVEQQQKRT